MLILKSFIWLLIAYILGAATVMLVLHNLAISVKKDINKLTTCKNNSTEDLFTMYIYNSLESIKKSNKPYAVLEIPEELTLETCKKIVLECIKDEPKLTLLENSYIKNSILLQCACNDEIKTDMVDMIKKVEQLG